MTRTRRLASSDKAVLRKFAERGKPFTWSRVDGITLYETRALTEMVCQSLVSKGHMDEVHREGDVVYQLNRKGTDVALQLLAEFDGFYSPTGR